MCGSINVQGRNRNKVQLAACCARIAQDTVHAGRQQGKGSQAHTYRTCRRAGPPAGYVAAPVFRNHGVTAAIFAGGANTIRHSRAAGARIGGGGGGTAGQQHLLA